MFRYILLRLGYFVLTFFVVSLILFALSRLAPGDPVDKYMSVDEPDDRYESYADFMSRRQAIANQYHLDKPPFYISIVPYRLSKDMYQLSGRQMRKWYKQLVYSSNRPSVVWQYIDNLGQLQSYLNTPEGAKYINLKNELAKVKYSSDLRTINAFASLLQIVDFEDQSEITSLKQNLLSHTSSLFEGHTDGLELSMFIPKIFLHGTNNQYHFWIKNFIKGNFGLSDFDRRPVKTRIWDALFWTLLINFISIFFAYLISIPLGVYSADKVNGKLDRAVSLMSMMLYALPSFWVATLFITFLTSYEWLHWFPSGGLGRGEGQTSFGRLLDLGYHLVLPIFCVTYIALAFIIRQVRSTLKETLEKDFIKTAEAKGLPHKKVLWRHGFRNSLLPLITLFANILPATIAGSVVVEIIFSIPGMGRLAFDGILQQDWNLVFTIMMLATLLTLLGNLLADLLYLRADPRISLTTETTADA